MIVMNKEFSCKMSCSAFVLLIVLCGLSTVRCSLTIEGVKCGQKTCKLSDYCSDFDKTCRPCAVICNSYSHNYDKSLCEEDCQDYLHDQRYVRAGGNGNGTEDLRSTVQQLSRMLTVTLTLVCLMLVVLASVLFFQLYRWKVKRNITIASIKNKLIGKKVPETSTPVKTNNIPISENKKSELRLEIPSSVSETDNSPVTVTTSISRRPAEDSTLDYAYDNPAMAPNPR